MENLSIIKSLHLLLCVTYIYIYNVPILAWFVVVTRRWKPDQMVKIIKSRNVKVFLVSMPCGKAMAMTKGVSLINAWCFAMPSLPDLFLSENNSFTWNKQLVWVIYIVFDLSAQARWRFRSGQPKQLRVQAG